MLEKQLIKNIHKHLSKDVHRQSMTYGSLNMTGTPDYYYDADGILYPRKIDLWIEYKQLKSMPRNGIVIGDYSDRQDAWLNRRGSNAWGIVGLPDRTAVIQHTHEMRVEGTNVNTAHSYKHIDVLIEAAVLHGLSSWATMREII